MNEQPVYHKSVLVSEVIEYLAPQPGGVYVDATFGGGGHTRAILQAEPGCQVIGVDWDQTAIEVHQEAFAKEFGDRLRFVWGNFAQLPLLLKKIGVRSVDGILADFGTSQDQLKTRAGFSFASDTPLDMRMSAAHQRLTAADVINRYPPKVLRDIFLRLGEERHAAAIADAIVVAREKSRFKTTGELVAVIKDVMIRVGQQRLPIHPATRVFQALRIYVNHELENIESLLAGSMHVLKPGGRIVCISFHSLEDRRVKQFFTEQARAGALKIVTPHVVQAQQSEVVQNPSSRSARLRAAQKA